MEEKDTKGVDVDAQWLDQALAEAALAGRLGNVPVGAVVLFEGRIVARAANSRETCHDATAHAELLAIREAGRVLGSWRLDQATLYVTMEPCLMCAGAILQSRLKRVVYGATEPKTGAHQSRYRVFDGETVRIEQHHAKAEACAAVMTSFFEETRRRRSER